MQRSGPARRRPPHRADGTGRPARRAIVGFAPVDREGEIRRHMEGLALMGSADGLRANLRAARRARLSATGCSDPGRHAALLRLLKRKAPP